MIFLMALILNNLLDWVLSSIKTNNDGGQERSFKVPMDYWFLGTASGWTYVGR